MELKAINLGSYIFLLNNLFSKTENTTKNAKHYFIVVMTMKSLTGLKEHNAEQLLLHYRCVDMLVNRDV